MSDDVLDALVFLRQHYKNLNLNVENDTDLKKNTYCRIFKTRPGYPFFFKLKPETRVFKTRPRFAITSLDPSLTITTQ